MSQTPRHIRTDRSLNRPDQAASAAPRRAAASGQGPVQGGAHSEPPRRPAQSQSEPPRRRKKKKKTPIWLPLAVVLAVIAVVSGVVVYAVSLVNRVEDSLRPDDSTPTIQEEIKTAEGYKGDVVNILVCGIDYEEGRAYGDAESNDGMTDMILYVQFDIKGNALRMLQIPRNSLVTTANKKVTLSNGKTYAASNYQINSVALSNGGSIAAMSSTTSTACPSTITSRWTCRRWWKWWTTSAALRCISPTICPTAAASCSRATAIWTALRQSSSCAAATATATRTPTLTA